MNLSISVTRQVAFALVVALTTASNALAQGNSSGPGLVTYAEIAPVLTKYCAGCHNEDEQEGEFSLANLDSLTKGTPDGPVLVSGKPGKSKLLRLITGEAEPKMPPEDEPQLKNDEVELIRAWIVGGLKSSSTKLETPSAVPEMPSLKSAPAAEHFVSSATAIGDRLYIGKLGRVEAFRIAVAKADSASVQDWHSPIWTFDELPGKVNSLRASRDGQTLIVGSGVAGVLGEAVLIHAETGQEKQRLTGHRDLIYSASISPNGQWVATGSYDRTVRIWDTETGSVVRELTGHNGAIYDLDFDPTGQVLATASADQTVKLWNVKTGERLDTLGQPEGEMLCVRFSPDGNAVYAAGADRQIRKWQLLSHDQPAINPMLAARYAHESDIVALRWVGDNLLSASIDSQVKAWAGEDLRALGPLVTLADMPVGICVPDVETLPPIAVDLKGRQYRVSIAGVSQSDAPSRLSVADTQNQASLVGADPASRLTQRVGGSDGDSDSEDLNDVMELDEAEPNGTLDLAMQVRLPVSISGKIHLEDGGLGNDELEAGGSQEVAAEDSAAEDEDYFRFTAAAGETWWIEASAGKGSPVDTLVDVLDASGDPVLRTRLQALRESYFTFRGKNSDTSDDFRLHKWEDMSLDEFLYSNGEVNRLWLYPRGPDSGFKVYPGIGKRFTYFGSTAITHALGEPSFVVRELAPEESPVPNGLPVFPIYFRNDDDPSRRAGKDSRLEFIAPDSGDYWVRLRDSRGFGGTNYSYHLKIRRPDPDFSIQIDKTELAVPAESGREWKVTATRTDGLSGPISIRIENLPAGFVATNPLIIEAGQISALGTIFATASAVLPQENEHSELADNESGDQSKKEDPFVDLELVASSVHAGRVIEHRLDQTIKLTLTNTEEVQVKLFPVDSDEKELELLRVHRGETVSARVVVERNGTESRIGFGKEDSGRNLPHGAFVDNIGLNGLLITEQLSEREFFITADEKLKPGRRQFHLRSDTKGNPTSRPIWLEVLP